MEIEIEYPNGGLEKVETKRSKYQILSLDLLARSRQIESPLGYIESEKMKNPEYFRLFKDENFVGFKRIVTEYLPAAATRWQLDPVPHDSEETQKLSRPAMGIATLGREKIVTAEQRRVTNPKSLSSPSGLGMTD